MSSMRKINTSLDCSFFSIFWLFLFHAKIGNKKKRDYLDIVDLRTRKISKKTRLIDPVFITPGGLCLSSILGSVSTKNAFSTG